MKRRISISLFILTVVLVIPSLVYATPVNIETANQVANNWYLERSEENYRESVESIETFFIRENSQDIYYVFNFREGGYIIIAADNAVVPVLGYNFEHHFGLENHPPQFDAMLASFIKQIVYAKENNLSASKEAQDEWERLNVRTENFEKNRDFSRLGPLLDSMWNQNYSWNTYCPADSSGPGGYVYAGCVAVAMAQIMNYWGHPVTGTDSHGYTHPTYGYLFADFGATTYSFPMDNTSPTNASKELLYHCGVSVDMDYGPTGSGAYTSDVVSALETYFDYDTSAYFDEKVYYSNTEWENMIRDNLNDSRPLQYRGFGASGGHSFNLDGYEDLDISHFHFNWGWSGSYNGYYYLSSLNPGTYDFTSDQSAIFDIFPVSSAPGVPTTPNPTDGATGISIDTMISWTNGANTDDVDVYFSSTQTLVTDKDASVRIYSGTAISTIDPSVGSLDYNTPYYWRVVCKNSARAETDGPVWSFTTESQVVVDTLSYYPDIPYYMSVPDEYDVSKYGVYFTPLDSCDLTKIIAYFYGINGAPTSCDLRIYDALVDSGNGKEYPNNLLHTENIPISSIPTPTTWYIPEIILSSPIHFNSGENFFIVYEIVGVYDTDQVNLLKSGTCEGTHSIAEYSGSWYYHSDLWYPPFEMVMDAVVEYQSAPEFHDYEVSTLYFYGYFLPTETRANIDFEADIFNNGIHDETNVEIELIVTDTTYSRYVVYSNSQYISLNSGVGGTVYFDTWSVSTPGEYIVTVTSKLTDDYEPNNDMIDLEQQVCSYPTELTYDDGSAESAWVKTTTGNGFANKFTPPYIPYAISDISFHVWADTWPVPGSNEMEIMILDDDGTDGSPGTILHEEVVTVVRGAWNTYDLSGSRDVNLEDGSFYVASITTADYPNCPGQSVDRSGPFAGQNVAWDFGNGVWSQNYASFGDEYMIRATVNSGSFYPPVIAIEIINDGADVELTWDPVPDANSYNVYSSLDPYGAFTIEPTGTAIPGTSWSESTSEKKFYYVIASTDVSSRNLNQYGKSVITRLKSTLKEFDNDSKSIGKPNKTNTLKRVR